MPNLKAPNEIFPFGYPPPVASEPLTFPPGVTHRRHQRPVTTCEQAAALKGIPLAHELKTLVVRTGKGLVLCHLPGDRQLSLRKVKRLLHAEEAHLATTIELASLDVEPGTVCPFRPALQALPAFLDPSVLDYPAVSTNDGTRLGAVFFAPALLLDNPAVRVADCTITSAPP